MVDLKGSPVSVNVEANVGPGIQGVSGTLIDELTNYSGR
jgi:hypothetical protein